MILDTLENAVRYAALHAKFAEAFDFLKRHGVAELPAGRHEIDGDRLFAIVGKDHGKGRDKARLEAHRRYIDIQYVVSGDEWIGWRDLATCRDTGLGYDEQKEIEFYTEAPVKWFRVPPGSFAIFFPDDAHAPLAGEGPVHKVVMKVAVGG